MVHSYIFIFPKKNCISLKTSLVSAKSEDPDEMLHYAAFHRSLHCLPKYSFWSQQYIKGSESSVLGGS